MALQLRARGIPNVRPLAGGLDAWRALGLPVDGEPAAPAPVSRGAAGGAAASLGALELVDAQGGHVRLASLWEQRPVVLVFLRHFGCMLCRDLVQQLLARGHELRAAGARLVAIGHGRPEAAARFHQAFDLDFPLLVDEDRRSYAELGLARHMGGSAHPGVVWAALRAWRRGARQGPIEGDPWQLGGAVVVAPGGAILYEHASRHAGDAPDLDAILHALREFRGDSAA